LSSCQRVIPKVLRAFRSLLLLIIGSLLVASVPATDAASPIGTPIEPLPPDVKIETVVPTAIQLVAMDFTPDGRLLYTERTGKVRIVVDGQLLATPVYPFLVDTQGERGLLGIAVDPNFSVNRLVWVYLTRPLGGNPPHYENRVVQFVLEDNNQATTTVRTQGFPVDPYATIHNGGNLHFGPDGKLYVTVGNNNDTNDAADPAQKLASPLGKIHRFEPTVPLSIPGDNPFGNNSIYAYGLRNSFDFAFDPISGELFATENGPSCDDEINRIVRGGNYGWRPFYPCDDAAPAGPDPAYNTLPPLIFWTPSLAPTGLTFYTGDLMPEWKNDLFICSYKDATTALHHFKLNASRTAIVSHTILSDTLNHQPVTCRTDLLTGPDGALYYSEAGGWESGPIKRLTRPTSFVFSSVSANPVAVHSDDVLTYTLDVRHTGTLSNTFTLTATLSPSTTLEAASSGLTFDSDHVYWSGTLSRTQSITATYTVRMSDLITTPYFITSPIKITAPRATPVQLNSVVIVNGYSIFLPIMPRD